MDREVRGELLKHQKQFFDSESPMVFLRADFGAGKRFVASRKALVSMAKNPGCMGLVYGKSRKHLLRHEFPAIIEALKSCDIKYDYKPHYLSLTAQIGGCSTGIQGYWDGDLKRSRGIEFAWSWISGVDLLGWDELHLIGSRTRVSLAQVFITGTCEETHWLMKFMDSESAREKGQCELIDATGMQNAYLPAAYYEALSASSEGDS